MSKFKREERYIVIKRKHLSEPVENAIKALLAAADINTIDCVVVEKDWPEYEPTWKAIEKRVSGKYLGRMGD